MFLNSIYLTNFRNFESFKHDFTKNLTIVYGKNATGKTNFLEGVQFLSFSKSFRAKHDNDIIFWPKESQVSPNQAQPENTQKDFAKVQGEIKTKEENFNLDISIKKINSSIGKIIKINEVKKNVSDLIGKCVSVVFSPEDILLISGSPSLRRRFTDIILAQQDLHYYHYLLELKKVLLNRNKLLFNIKERRAKVSDLDFWDEKLVHCSEFIILKRKQFFDFLNSKIGEIYNTVAGEDKKKLNVFYLPCVDFKNESEIYSQLKNALFKAKNEEIRRARTLVGPHHDDFSFYLDKRNLSCFGSRGEWRSTVLSLKILELDYLENNLGERPILLLDDIFSELDFARRNHLAEIVKKQQTIITATELDFISKEFIENGEMMKINPPPLQ